MFKFIKYDIIINKMAENLLLNSIKFVIRDLLGDIIYFPIWWYTRGAKKVSLFCWHETKQATKRLSIGILFSHLLKPMYGQRDIAGRIISFFFRILQFVWHLLFLFLWLVIMLVVLVVWFGLPVFTIWQIIILI